MAKPSDKSPKMNEFLDETAKRLYGRSRTGSITRDTCVCCEADCSPESFADDLSKVEYSISGFCQKCQDEFFGVASRVEEEEKRPHERELNSAYDQDENTDFVDDSDEDHY